jgi:hypothetical protein
MNTNIQPKAKRSNRQLVSWVAGLTLLTGGASYYGISHLDRIAEVRPVDFPINPVKT